MKPTESVTRYCGAKTRQGGQCRREAGWGTNHVGAGKCKLHGGSHHNGQMAGAKEAALIYAAERFGLTTIQPTDAMLMCVRDTAGFVAYCKMRVAEIQGDGEGLANEKGELNVWVRWQLEGTKSLAQYAKWALEANVAEREVQLAERMGLLLASAMGRVLDALDLDKDQRSTAVRVWGQALAELETEDVV